MPPAKQRELEIQIGMRLSFGRRFVIAAERMVSLNLPSEAAELNRLGERMVSSATRDLEKLCGEAKAHTIVQELDEWITSEPSEQAWFPPGLLN